MATKNVPQDGGRGRPNSTAHHAPIPWKAVGLEIEAVNQPGVARGIGRVFAYPSKGVKTEQARANAAFIVRAVNAHDELVAALQAIMRLVPADIAETVAGHKARAALRSAEGTTPEEA